MLCLSGHFHLVLCLFGFLPPAKINKAISGLMHLNWSKCESLLMYFQSGKTRGGVVTEKKQPKNPQIS